VPVFALLILTGSTTYQSIVLRRQLVPTAIAEFTLHPDARGDEMAVSVPETAPFFILAADVPGIAHDLKWKIRGASGAAVLIEGTASAPPEGAPLTILVPVSKLKPGPYVLSISDGFLSTGAPTALHYRFRMH
jgi:hypothetical protein